MSDRQQRHEAAVKQAIAIAARNPLPLVARSLTAAENRAAQRKEIGCLFDGGAMLLVIAPFTLLLSGDPDFAWRVAPWCLGAAPLVWAIGWLLKWRAGRGYVDPGIEIEAAADGLTIRRGQDVERLDYGALSLAVRPGAFERNPFLSVVLDLPAGPIELDNSHFRRGRTTGAAILAKVQAAGGAARPAEA
ncbi:hypothetical protein [Sphingosinicella sp.]|uniref:hypothetical protein n=1 Tax=Sphingosinicella sp. TaxID=1917971 RepID=UPI004037FB4E